MSPKFGVRLSSGSLAPAASVLSGAGVPSTRSSPSYASTGLISPVAVTARFSASVGAVRSAATCVFSSAVHVPSGATSARASTSSPRTPSGAAALAGSRAASAVRGAVTTTVAPVLREPVISATAGVVPGSVPARNGPVTSACTDGSLSVPFTVASKSTCSPLNARGSATVPVRAPPSSETSIPWSVSVSASAAAVAAVVVVPGAGSRSRTVAESMAAAGAPMSLTAPLFGSTVSSAVSAGSVAKPPNVCAALVNVARTPSFQWNWPVTRSSPTARLPLTSGLGSNGPEAVSRLAALELPARALPVSSRFRVEKAPTRRAVTSRLGTTAAADWSTFAPGSCSSVTEASCASSSPRQPAAP